MMSSAKLALFAGLILAASPAVASPAATPSAPAAPAASSPASPVQKLYGQTYGDWTYRCLAAAAAAAAGQPATTTCFVQQQLVFSNNGHTSPLLTVTFLKAAKGHDMNIIVPLGVALRPGIEMSVDNEKSVNAAYSFCNNTGCAVIGAPAFAITRDVHTAKTGHAKIGLMNGKPLTINFSLKGLAQALAALDSGVPPKREIQPG